MDQHTIITLTSADIVKWCRERKKSLGYSNQKLAELTGVPIGTIDRIMSGNYTEFKYSSIQPIVSTLLGQNQETPEPIKDNDKQAQYYYETIEGYKIVLDSKNREIEALRRSLHEMAVSAEFLKTENINKERHITWLENMIDQINKGS